MTQTVLLVEDSPADALLVLHRLEEAGGERWRIRHVDALRPALDWLGKDDIDVVLLDLSLPDSFGLATLERLRAQNPRVPVVVLTGAADDATGIRALELGAQDYLVKDEVSSTRALRRSIRHAIERSRSAELRLRDAAARAEMTEEEQRRALAADLHDDVGQLLTLLAIKLRVLQDSLDADRGRAVGELQALVYQARQRISSLSFELSPALLFDVGLVAAAERLAEDVERDYGLHVELDTRGEVEAIDEVTRVALYRSLRELLINAAKHADTPRARVAVRTDTERVELRVTDEGQGFELERPTAGFGLISLRNRIESLGGSLEIASAPGFGAKCRISLPLRNGNPK